MSACGQRLAGLGRERGGPARGRQLAGKDVGRQRLGRRVRRLEHHETERSEHRFEPRGERPRHADARPPGGPKGGDDVGREFGGLQGRREFVDGPLDAGVEDELRDGQLARAVEIRQGHRPRLELGVEHRTASDFLPVVILGIHPEHGDRGDPLLALGPARELQGGQGLQQGEQRSAEDTGLLSGDDRDRGRIGQAGGGGARLGGRAPGALLRREDRGDRGAVTRMLLSTRHGVAPGRGLERIAGVQALDALEVVGVVARERPHPGKAAHVDSRRPKAAGGRGGGPRGRRLDRHGPVLSQSGWKPVKAAEADIGV